MFTLTKELYILVKHTDISLSFGTLLATNVLHRMLFEIRWPNFCSEIYCLCNAYSDQVHFMYHCYKLYMLYATLFGAGWI